MSGEQSPPARLCRRALLAAGGAAAAVCATGCETTYDPGPAATRGGPSFPGSTGAAAPAPDGPTTTPAGPSTGPSTGPSAAPDVLGPAAAVPVGGGVVYPRRRIVVTQPAAGDFRAFSAICTHARCLVSEVTEEGIYCPCHASVFSISNGAALRGPATKALREVKVSEDGGNLRLA